MASFTHTVQRPATVPTPPALTAAHVVGTTLTLLFDQALDAGSAPAGHRFRVTCATCDWIRGTGTATVSGKKVTVTLASAAPQDESAYVFYAKGDDASPLRGAASGPEVTDIAMFIASELGTTPPALVEGSVAGTRVTLYYDKALDTDSTPAAGDFTVTAASSAQTVDSVSMSETAVTLTLASAVSAGHTVTVSYTPGTHPIRDLAGQSAARLTNEAVANRGSGDPGKPALAATDPAVVDGKVLTLTYDQPFDPTQVPGREAFAVSTPWRPVVGVAVRGRKVELSLRERVYPCTAAFTVSYAAPGAHALRNVWGTQADDIAEQAVTNTRAAQCVANWVDGAQMGSVILRARRPFATDAPPRAAWFTVAATGGPVTVTGAAFSADDPHELRLALSREHAAQETVTVSYRRPRNEPGLWDVDGHQLADVTDVPVTHETPAAAPSVTTVAVVSDAGADGAYTEGETVEAVVRFSAPVTVGTGDGTPALALIADGTIRRASYVSGSDTERLVFAYRVGEAEGRFSAPVRVAASGLKRNGGAIVDAADGMPAELAFGAAPGVTAVAVSHAPAGGWEVGDTVAVTLRFAEPVMVEGAPSVALSFGGVERRAAYARGSGGPELTFAYTLAEADGGQGAVGVVADSLSLDGGSILSAGGGLAAALAHPGAESVPAPAAPAAPAKVTGVAVVSDAGDDATYALGETIRVRLTFGKAVAVDTAGGTPRMKIKMNLGWGEKWAAYEGGSGTNALTFVYTVVKANATPHGIAVLANTLEANGGTIASAATGTAANLAHAGLDHDPAHKVDWRLSPPAAPGAPAVTGVAVVSGAGADDTYLLDEVIHIRVTFSEAVTVTGSPRLTIRMDPRWGEKRAVYEGASDTAARALTFAWTVVEPNYAPQGIAVLADTLILDGGTIRSAATGADAALGHAGLAHDAAHKVDWRPALSVGDARAREGVDEAVEFEVSLDRAFTGAGHRVRVDYATADGTAKAGEDYTAVSGTLTFVAGERVKTVAVPILDDGHDEGHETFVLRLSNVRGARVADGEATGTIENTDRMPSAWLARFGRTVAAEVVEGVQARLDAPRSGGAEAKFAGQALPWLSGGGGAGMDEEEAVRRDAERLARWLAGEDEEKADDTRGMTGREILAQSAFSVTVAPQDGGPSAALWGRGASSRFSGREGALTLDGEVTSATLGADWRSVRWLAGVMVKHSRGEGSYSGDGGAGAVESTLTGVYPYVGFDATERLRLWAAAGYGEGTLALTPENPVTAGADDPAMETDLSLGLVALGAKGALVEPAGGRGLSLDVEADALWVRTASEDAPGLAGAKADATRVRLGLAGRYAFALEGGATLEPTFEVGLRHDGGDAETGYGVDLGGGLKWSNPALGLSAQLSARGLLAHEASGFSDRGISGSFAWDPDPSSERGPSLTVTQTMGASATGGMDTLLGRETLAGLAANDDGPESRRLEVKLGYGLGAFGGRFTATPELELGVSNTGREYGLGWRLGPVRSGLGSFDLRLRATRREAANDDVASEHDIRLELNLRF